MRSRAPQKNESYDRQQLRGTLFRLLGAANDPAVLAQARQLTARVYAAGNGKRQDSRPNACRCGRPGDHGPNGDAALYEKILAVSKDPTDPGQQTDALHTLARFRDPARW